MTALNTPLSATFSGTPLTTSPEASASAKETVSGVKIFLKDFDVCLPFAYKQRLLTSS